MQAITFQNPGVLIQGTVDDPRCNQDEVVIKVNRAGICGTDLHIFRNEYQNKFPIIPGHEFFGEIVETGKHVKEFKAGDRVAVDPNLNCGQCYFCRTQQANHCLNWEGIGITRSGGFAEFVSVPVKSCYKVPSNLSPAQAAFIEPLSCVIYALNRLNLYPAMDVLIFGAGPMGLLLIQAFKQSVASKIIVIEKDPERCKIARRLGATEVILSHKMSNDTKQYLPYGFSLVVDATGVPEVIENALTFLKAGGQYLQFGVSPKNATVRWNPYQIFRNDWKILGSFALCYTFEQAISWFSGGNIDVDPLISHIIPFTEFQKGFNDFSKGRTLKVHIDFNAT